MTIHRTVLDLSRDWMIYVGPYSFRFRLRRPFLFVGGRWR